MPLSSDEILMLADKGFSPQDIHAYEQKHDAGMTQAKPVQAPAAEPGLGAQAVDYVAGAPKRAFEGAVATIPYAGRVQRLLQGQEAYPEPAGIERTAAKIGDASQTLLTGATLGRGLGAGLAINAGLEASGINPLARKLGAGAENLNEKVVHDFPSEKFGVEGLGTAMNFAQRIPGAAVGLAANLAPAILAGKKISGVQEAGLAKAAAKAEPTAQALEDLKAHGGEVPISAQVPTGVGKAVAGVVERGAKVDPFTKGAYEDMDVRNGDAAKKFFQSTHGPDIFDNVKEGIGKTMSNIMDRMVQRREAKFQPVMDQLKKAGKTRGFGNMIADDVVKAMGDNPVVDQVSGPFATFIKEIRGIDDPIAIKKKLSSMRAKFKLDNADGFGKVNSELEHDYGTLNGAAKDAFYNGLDKISGGLDNKLKIKPLSAGKPMEGPSGDLGKKLREANGDYAADSKPIGALSDILSQRDSPEYAMQTFFQKGTKDARAILAEMDPSEKKIFQKEAGRWLVDQSKNPQNGNVTAKGLEKIPVKYRDILPAIFDDAHGKSILGYIERGKKLLNVANINEIGNANPSGTGKTLLEQAHSPAALAASMSGGLMAGGLKGALYPLAIAGTKVGADLAYTHGLPAALKVSSAINKAPVGFTPAMPKGLSASGNLANILRLKQQQQEAEQLQR